MDPMAPIVVEMENAWIKVAADNITQAYPLSLTAIITDS